MHPVLIQTKFFNLNTLWIFVVAGFIIGTYLLIKLSSKQGLKIQFISDHSLKIFFWFIVGARISHIFLNTQTYFYEFSLTAISHFFYIWDKGLNLWGGIIAATIYFYIICQKKEQNFFKWVDVIVPAFIIGLAIGHIGAFFDGINYGRETSLPWGVNFESPSIKYAVPIHPTQIYAFLYSTALAVVLISISKVPKIVDAEKKGLIGLIGIGTYALLRFLEGFLRGDDTYLIFGARLPQIMSFIILISTGIFLYLRYNKPAKKRKVK